MSVWVLHLKHPQPSSAELKKRDALPMPFEASEDYTLYASQHALKQKLRLNAPDMPPESITREAERIWSMIFAFHEEDFIAVPLAAEKTVLFAQVNGRVRYAGTHFEIPVKWYDRETRLLRFRRFPELFRTQPQGALLEAADRHSRIAIRDKLPLPGNRFARIKWIIVLLIAAKMCIFAVHLWRRETAGF